MHEPLILTIDDERHIRESFRNYLEDHDFIVITAENGRVGLELFEQHHPDLVLVDLRMPEVDGLQVLQQIHTAAPDTPLIVISGTGVITDAVEALRLGAWDYLLKPVEDLDVLLHAVRRCLERASLIRENRRYQQNLEEEIKNRTAELEKTYSSLRESEEKFVKIFQFSPDAIVISRMADNRIIDVNETFTNLLGFSRDEAVGHTTSELDIWVSDDDRRSILQRLQTQGECLNFNTNFRNREGVILAALYSSRTFELAGENHAISIARDMTEQRKLENQLMQAQKMESIGRLAGGVAHDFNNLLTSIMGYTEMTICDLEPEDPHYHHLNTVYRAAENAKILTRQLLAFGRKQVLEMLPTDLGAVLQGFERIIRRTIREDIRIEFRLAPDLNPVRADSAQLEQIIMNLAVNAQDAMPGGGTLLFETANVDLDEEYVHTHPGSRPETYVMLAVSDSGCGMDQNTLRNLFEPFFTTKPVGQGTGLGLSTVYGIVKQHDGNIFVYSEPGQGSTFKIYLPQIDESPQTKEMAENLSPPGGSEEIMVVEDNQAVRKLAVRFLENGGYRVREAGDPEECIEILTNSDLKVDLLLTDVVMPGMNGRELFEKLAASHPDLKVLYMSGYTDEAIARHGVLNRGVHFIQKPFSIHDLLKKVRETIDSPSGR